MTHIDKTIQVDVPIRTAYDQWTQFEDFPRFAQGIEAVTQLDPCHLSWTAKIGGKEVEWTAEIVEQVPDQVIAWRSTSGAQNVGRLTFRPIGTTRAEVRLSLDYEPESFGEKVGDAFGVVTHAIATSLENYKAFVESRQTATGAWRGRIQNGILAAEPPPEEFEHPSPPAM